jgi:hypothetical protein
MAEIERPRKDKIAREIAASRERTSRFKPSRRFPEHVRTIIQGDGLFRTRFPGWSTETPPNITAFARYHSREERGDPIRALVGQPPNTYRRDLAGIRSLFPNFDTLYPNVTSRLGYGEQTALFNHLRAVRERRDRNTNMNRRHETALIGGDTTSVARYEATDGAGIVKILERYRHAVTVGDGTGRKKFFVIRVKLGHRDGDKYYTLADKNFNDLVDELANHIAREDSGGEVNHSDEEFADYIIDNEFEIGDPATREAGRRQSRVNENQGAYFPFLHKFDCSKLKAVLHRLGVFDIIDPKNYEDNCLIHALSDAGVDQRTLAHIRTSCVTRSVPRRLVKQIAERHGLRISIHTFGAKNVVKIGPEDGLEIKLGLFKEHYFHIFDTDFNAWAVKNFETVKHKPFWWQFVKKGARREGVGMDTFKLLKTLVENDLLELISVSTDGVLSTQFHDKADQAFTTLEFPDEAVKLSHPPRFVEDTPEDKLKYKPLIAKAKKAYDNEEGQIHLPRLEQQFEEFGLGLEEQLAILKKNSPHAARYCLDFETTTNGVRHVPYLGCFKEEKDDQIITVYGETCALEFLDYLANNHGVLSGSGRVPTVAIKCHNASYDIPHVMRYLENLNLVERGTSLICGGGTYKTQRLEGQLEVRITIQDTVKIIGGRLSGFSKLFNLEVVKEVMPYDLYTEEFIESGGIASTEDLRGLEDYKEIMMNLVKWGCDISPGKWDMIQYSATYCEFDVKLLSQGWDIFQKDTLEHTGINVNYVPTTASLADAYMKMEGAYRDVYTISGVVRQFVERCIVGGRVCCAGNKKSKFTRDDPPKADFDATSLYPAAMFLGPGYPKGVPQVWHNGLCLEQVDAGFFEILVEDTGREWNIPIYCVRSKQANEWTDRIKGEKLFLDKTTLLQLETYLSTDDHPFRYTILRGYYFNDGFNTIVKNVIDKLFKKRLELKAIGSPGQIGVKLLMNTAFGMTGRKADLVDVKYVPPDRIITFMHNHYASIKCIADMPNGYFRVEKYKAIDDHFNKAHLCCGVLSYSKKIMNEVTCTAEDCGARVDYTDTDSMHLAAHMIPKIAEKFKLKYDKNLIGKQMGQFHSDFDFAGSFFKRGNKLSTDDIKSQGEILSVASYFLGKKSYMDLIEDEAGNTAYHIRLKGIPGKCIVSRVNQDYQGDPMLMFEDFYQGKPVTFNLGEHGHVMFKTHKNHTVETVQMPRTVQFK